MSPFVNWSFLQAETPPTQTGGAKGGSVKVHIPLVLKILQSGPKNIFPYVFLIKFLKSRLGLFPFVFSVFSEFWGCENFVQCLSSNKVLIKNGKHYENLSHLVNIMTAGLSKFQLICQNFFDGAMPLPMAVGYRYISWFFISNWPSELIKFRPSYLPQHLPQHVKKVNIVPGQYRVGGHFLVGGQKNRICQRTSWGS